MGAYQKRIWKALAVQAAGAAAGAAAIVVLGARARQLPLGVVLSGFILAGVLILAAGQPWWRQIDEMEREEHAIAWYEGSIPGATIALLAMLGVSAHFRAHWEMAEGGAICFTAQAVLYFVFFAIRRASRHARGAS